MHCCQAEPSLGYPDLLRERVRSATAAVKGREARRRRFFVMTVAAGVLAAAGVVWGLWWWRVAVGRKAQALADLRTMREEAEHGAYDAMPERAEAIVAEYEGDVAIDSEGTKLETAVARERKRRGSVSKALGDFESAVQRARSALEERESKKDPRLEQWDDSVIEAAEAWREARRVGGEPAKREPPASGELSLGNRPRAAQDVLAAEETRIEDAKRTQLDLEKDYANAAIDEFRRQRKVIEEAIPKSDAVDRAEVARKLLKDLESLIKRGKEPKADRIDRLVGDPLRKSRVPYVESEAATLLGESLKRLIQNSSGS